MTLETFFEKFDQFADAPGAPGAVGKMRELVLHLAFSGKLLPAGEPWPLKPLKSLAVKIGSGATPAGGKESYFTEGIPLIRSMNVHFAGFEPKGLVFLSDEQAKQLANVTVQPGDVLLNITGASIGRVTTAPPEMAGARVNQHVAIIRPIKELDAQFLAKFLASPAIQRMIDDIQVGATREALTKGMIEQFDIPLPPLAEQKRIVAKVDELMALCERLEAQQQEREAQAGQLARASLARFTDAPTPANLNLLFHSSFPISPSDLRKSILTLAVQGKLVPQDTNDEPADADFNSLVRIRNNSSLKRTKIDDEAVAKNPLIPDSWISVSLGELVSIRTGFAFKSSDYADHGTFILRVTNINPDGSFDTGNAVFLPQAKLDEKIRGFLLEENELLVVMVGGSLGKIGQVTAAILPALLNQNMWRLKPYSDHLDFRFLRLILEDLNENRLQITPSTHGHLAMGTYAAAKVPFPPIAEQHRIVAKVDELMALVDDLETQLAASRAAAENLLSALVAEHTGTTSRLPADS